AAGAGGAAGRSGEPRGAGQTHWRWARALRRCASHPAAAQNRNRRARANLPADGARHRLQARGRLMDAPTPKYRMRDILPQGLYWRTLLIIVAPAALLQLIITLVFL